MGDFLGGLPTVLIATAGGYLLGSIPLAYLISKRHSGVDIFEVGTGLPGASNVMRNVGKLPAVMVFLGDMAKGALAILLCNVMGVESPWLLLPVGAAIPRALEVDVHRLSGRRRPRHLSRRDHGAVSVAWIHQRGVGIDRGPWRAEAAVHVAAERGIRVRRFGGAYGLLSRRHDACIRHGRTLRSRAGSRLARSPTTQTDR